MELVGGASSMTYFLKYSQEDIDIIVYYLGAEYAQKFAWTSFLSVW